jgi:hypothetical protein
MMELIVFQGVSLATSNVQLVEGYLAWKWGIQSSLPVGHPYISTNPNTTIVLQNAGTINSDNFNNLTITSSNRVRIPVPLEYRDILSNVSTTSVTTTIVTSATTYRITNASFSGITVPTTLATTDTGVFWSFLNTTTSNLSVTITGTGDIASPYTMLATGTTVIRWNGSNYFATQDRALTPLLIQEISGTSLTLAASNYNNYFYMTNTGFNAMTLPASTATSNGGNFWSIRNATAGNLSITLTNTLTLASPLVIPSGNSATLAISGVNANTILLF